MGNPIENRPDWMMCVVDGVTHSWCGRRVSFEHCFESIDHAAHNGRDEGRIVACKDCVLAITKALSNGYEEDKS